MMSNDSLGSTEMSIRVKPASDSRTPAWLLSTAAAWIVGFLLLFFAQPIEDPHLPRSELWLEMLDVVLDPGGTDPAATASATPSGIGFLPQRLPLFANAALLLLLAAAHGDAVCVVLLRNCRLTSIERTVICFGAGLAMLSLVTLGCGLAGQLNPLAVIGPSVFSFAFAASYRWRKRRSADRVGNADSSAEQGSSKVLRLLVLIILVPYVAWLLLGSVSPPTDFDVLEYHLQGPKEWFQQGRVSFLPHNVYTSFPFLSEMLCLSGMVVAGDWWRGALVGQIVLACFQLLSALSVFAIARRWISRDVAWLATLIYLTTPWTLRISLIAYAEGSLSFYLISATMTALLIDRCEPARRWSLILASGLLAGSAMASKYTGLVSVILPTGAIIGWSMLRGFHGSPTELLVRELAGNAAWFSLGVLLMITPWLLRNLADTGNPVYPLGYSVFGGSEWSAEMNARWKPAHAPSEHRINEIPTHILDAAVRNKWTSALLFGLAIPSVLLWKRNRTIAIVLCFTAWGFFTWWALTHRIDRFWIPVIPLLSIAAGSTWMLSTARAWRRFLSVVIAGVTLFNLKFCTHEQRLIGFHAGLMDLDAARQLVIRPDFRLLNDTLPSSSKVLMVGEAEVFDATFPLVYNTVFDDCLFEEWTTHPDDAHLPAKQRRMLPSELIQSTLRAQGITHVYINWGEILRYRMPGSYGFTDAVQPSRFDELVRSGVLYPPAVLLARPWKKMSTGERRTVETWDGFGQLIKGDDNYSVVEFYEVRQK